MARRPLRYQLDLEWGTLFLESEPPPDAEAHLVRAIELAQELGLEEQMLSPLSCLALFDPAAVDRTLALLQTTEQTLIPYNVMNARYYLWRATREREHLAEAHRLLVHHRDHAPPEYREPFVENVPTHRNIQRAWEEHGDGQA